MRVGSLDPGSKNVGYAVTDHWIGDDLEFRCDVVQCGMVPGMPTSVPADAESMFEQLESAMSDTFLAAAADADMWAFERFMVRGPRVGAVAEIANLIIGYVCSFACGTGAMHMLPAVTWKNAFARMAKRNDLDALEDLYKVCCTPPHELDAALIGCYAASSYLLAEPFSMFVDRTTLYGFLDGLETATSSKLARRQRKRRL